MPDVVYTRHARAKLEVLRRHGFNVALEQVQDVVTAPNVVTRQSGGRFIA